MINGYSIRPLEESDFLPIHDTLTAWWDDWGDPQAAMQRHMLLPRLFFQHFADMSAVVSDSHGEVAAYVVGFMSQSREGEAYIHFVGVRPDLRGHGLGNELYKHFFASAERRRATRVSCVTSPGNTRSIGFHRAMGFEVVPGRPDSGGFDVQPNYDGEGIDRVCFVRTLDSAATTDSCQSTGGRWA